MSSLYRESKTCEDQEKDIDDLIIALLMMMLHLFIYNFITSFLVILVFINNSTIIHIMMCSVTSVLLLYYCIVGQVFWKCYEYGDDLVQIFEFIDDQRAKSVREIQIPDPETAEEFIDKHGSIVRSESIMQCSNTQIIQQ